MFFLCQGAVVQSSLVIVAELGIADLLAAGPQTADRLAEATHSHPQALYRVLRLLSSVGVFADLGSRRFALTPLSECLRSSGAGSMNSWVKMVGQKVWMHTWAASSYSVRTGEPALAPTIGAELFDYYAAHPEEGDVFNKAMDDHGRRVAEAIIQAYDFSGIDTIVDIGGGHGTMIAAILNAYSGMKGILFDLPHVVAGSEAHIRNAGVASRCEIRGGDFFQSVPAADAYLLRWIIHDWDHDRALAILRNCRAEMKETDRLLLIEAVVPTGDAPHASKMLDFVMLVAFGGQERTETEYADLLREAGFRLSRIVPTGSALSVIEGLLA
jgi:hypothetical protein